MKVKFRGLCDDQTGCLRRIDSEVSDLQSQNLAHGVNSHTTALVLQCSLAPRVNEGV